MKILLSAVIVACMATAAFAGAPATGVYLSLTQGGPLLDGHFSESWLPAAGPGQVGNTINAQSWDMSLGLGTEWKFYCASIAMPPTLIKDTTGGGDTGDIVWETQYTGGHFWLSQDGPWGDGTEDYIGDLDEFSVETTYKYVGGVLLGIRSNVTMSGHFIGYDNCLDYVITNSSVFGNTDENGMLPAEFPPFMDSSCGDSIDRGAWGDVTHIALQITGSCIVGTEETTWGAVKARYAD